MALTLDIYSKVKENGETLVIEDTTGVYSTSNTTGWGVGASPPVGSTQPYLKDISYAALTITPPTGDPVVIDIVNDLSITFNSDTIPSNLIYNITNTLMGVTTFADGIYKIVYNVSDGATMLLGNTATNTIYVGCFYNVEYEVLKHVHTLYQSYTNHAACTNEFLIDVQTMYIFLVNLKFAAKCGDMGAFTDILTTLQNITTAGSRCFHN